MAGPGNTAGKIIEKKILDILTQRCQNLLVDCIYSVIYTIT